MHKASTGHEFEIYTGNRILDEHVRRHLLQHPM
jgi:hypothetical protein